MPNLSKTAAWPSLPLEAWSDTCATLHMWTQIVGKIRLARSPWINHSWHVTLYVTGSGLTTGPIPYEAQMFQIDFDLVAHQLVVRADEDHAARDHRVAVALRAEIGRPLDVLLGLDVPLRHQPLGGGHHVPVRRAAPHGPFTLRRRVASRDMRRVEAGGRDEGRGREQGRAPEKLSKTRRMHGHWMPAGPLGGPERDL